MIRAWFTPGRLQTIAVTLLGIAIALAFSRLRGNGFNNYVLLADAFLHGRIPINWPGPASDALPWHGQHIVIEAPLPAILLLPAVAIWGEHTNQTLLAVLLGGGTAGVAWALWRRLNVHFPARIALTAFLFAGTDVLFCSEIGSVWYLAHVSAVFFTMLALLEAFGKKRGWLVALWAFCALESRFSLVLALPAYVVLLAVDDEGQLQWLAALGHVRAFVATLAACAIPWVAYNEARWGVPYDIGYQAWYNVDTAGSPTGSPFSLRFFPMEWHAFFESAPVFSAKFPWVDPTMFGIGLQWTSPALVLAFLARRPVIIVLAFWAAALATAAPSFVYYAPGYAQFGMRHALDFEPFLVVLMALGVRRRMPLWGYALCAYSALVGIWGCWYWNVYYS